MRLPCMATCLTNLRQQGIAVHVYAYDNKGFGPVYTNADQPTSGWSSAIDWSAYLAGGVDNVVHEIPGSGYPPWTDIPGRRKLNKYMDGLDGFKCPMDAGYYYSDWWPADWPWWGWTGNSYWYAANWNRGGTNVFIFWDTPLEAFKNVSRQVLLADADIRYALPGSFTSPEGPHVTAYVSHDRSNIGPHIKPNIYGEIHYDFGIVMAFLDGHAAYTPMGPYGIGDNSMNTARYIIDPDYD